MHRLLLLLPLAATLLSPDARADGCAAPTTNADLLGHFDAASEALGALAIDAFDAAATATRDTVRCLSEPISRANAAEFHRVQGLALFLQRNSPAARLSFAAARAIEPAYQFPSDKVPPGNPILEDYTALDPKVGPFELAPPPANGSLQLDGGRSMNRAQPLPVVFQLLDGQGAVVDTQLVDGGAPLPAYPVRDRAPQQTKGPSKPLLLAAAGGAVAAGAVYAAALAGRRGFDNETDPGALDARKRTTNALVVTSAALGVASVGVGGASLFVSGRF